MMNMNNDAATATKKSDGKVEVHPSRLREFQSFVPLIEYRIFYQVRNGASTDSETLIKIAF